MTMTLEEARNLNKGDYILYNGLKYKLLHVKEHRNAHTNELCITIKCSRQNEIIWLNSELIEVINYGLL